MGTFPPRNCITFTREIPKRLIIDQDTLEAGLDIMYGNEENGEKAYGLNDTYDRIEVKTTKNEPTDLVTELQERGFLKKE
jgi:hypothetical protein